MTLSQETGHLKLALSSKVIQARPMVDACILCTTSIERIYMTSSGTALGSAGKAARGRSCSSSIQSVYCIFTVCCLGCVIVVLSQVHADSQKMGKVIVTGEGKKGQSRS